MSADINSIRIKGAEAVSQLEVMTEILGDILAERYSLDDGGMEAIVYHLVQKHHWLPGDIRNMSRDDLRLVLSTEFEEHTDEIGQRFNVAAKANRGK